MTDDFDPHAELKIALEAIESEDRRLAPYVLNGFLKTLLIANANRIDHDRTLAHYAGTVGP